MGILTLPCGAEFLVSPDRWDKHCHRYGFRNPVSLDRDGKGNAYPRIMSPDPSGKRRARSTTLARLFVAERLVEEELAGGPKATAKGWIAHYKNGDHHDLRDENLGARPAMGHRNGIRAVWAVRKRARLVAEGLDPDAVFADRRRQQRAEEAAKARNVTAVTYEPVRAPHRANSPHRPSGAEPVTNGVDERSR